MKKRMISLLLALVMVLGLIPAMAPAARAETTASSRVESILSEMTLEEKITQMMMVDFRKWGQTADNATDLIEMNDEIRQILEKHNFGGVLLFSNNIKETKQTFDLVTGMQAAATANGGIAMLISSDNEGGNVYRLVSGTALPGNMALGATYAANGTKYAYEAGKIIGSELGVLGINANLAPVVDVNNNANNPVIGLRSYGDDAVMVGELASATIAGMAEYNVIGAAKHFPGHGDTATDAEYGLPMVNKSLSDLKKLELKPYEIAIEQGLEMVMVAHILYPQLESDRILSNETGEMEALPATMSDDIITDLLKGDMGFDGIVITDAMNMAGITACWNPTQAAIIAINAGVDMLVMPTRLYCQDDLLALENIIKGIKLAVQNGEIPMSRINDAVTRILTVKENRGILDYNAEDYTLENAQAVVGCEANREMEREMSAAAVTVVKNDGVLPLDVTKDSKVLMLCPYANERAQMIMGWNRAKKAGIIPAGAQVDYYRFSSSTTISSEMQEKLDWADTYIILSEVSSTSRMAYKQWLSAMPNTLCDYAAANGKSSVIISVDKPYDVQLYPSANAIMAVYGCKGSSVDPVEALETGVVSSAAAYGPNIIAGVEVALGTFGASGKLPVDIPVYDQEENYYMDDPSYERGYGLTYASTKKDPDIYVGGVGMFDGDYLAVGATTAQTTKPSGGYAYYKDGKLTLNNYSYEGEGYQYNSEKDYYAVIYSKNDLTLELTGNNTLTQPKSNSIMIYVYGAKLTVGGDGKLTGTSRGYALRADYDITINGGTIEVSTYLTCILSYGDVIINGGDIVAESVDRIGINTNDITINGGDVTAIGGYMAIGCATDGFSVADSMKIQASTTVDGELGEYVAANHDSYKKIVIKTPGVYVGGVGMYDGDYLAVGATETTNTQPSGGYAYYKDGKLTLNNYSYEGKGYQYDSTGYYYAVIYTKNDLTLELIGNNTLNQTKSYSDMIDVDGANLTVGGDGKLTGTAEGYGLYAYKGITINGGTIEVSTCDTSISSYGGEVIINDGDITAESEDYTAIYSYYDVTVNGGNVTAIGGYEAIDYGSSGSFTVAEGMKIQASTTVDGELGEYVAENHASYEKIVITEKPVNPFTDVKEGDFFYDPVMWAVQNGITTGATPTTFDPNGKCLRAHVVTFLHRAAGNPEPTSTNNPFTDVASGNFFYKPVLWAVEKNITNGTSATTFGSYNNCNRAAVVTFLWRAAGSPEPTSTNNPFVDVPSNAFYYKAVLWAVEKGITNGIDATHFGPTTDCNRAQVVTFLYRAYN